MLSAQPGSFKSDGSGISPFRVGAIIFGAICMIAASWLRAAIAKTIMVDGHALTGLPAFWVLFLFCGGLTLYSLVYFDLWHKNSLSLQHIRFLASGLAILFSFMLPLLSNDVFSVLTYGDLANHGVDIYSQGHLKQASSFAVYCNPQFANGPNVYGPLFTGMLQLSTYFFPHNIFAAIGAYKLLALVFAVIFIEVAYRTALYISASTGFFLFVVLNPVFLLQGLGQLHCDLFAATLCICIVHFVTKGKSNLAFLFAALSIAVKLNYLLVVPYILMALYMGSKSKPVFFRKLIIGSVIVGATLFAAYYPYFTSINNLMLPFWTVYNQIPSKSIPEVFGDVIFYIYHYFSGQFHSGSIMADDTAVASQKLIIWTTLETICRIVALLASGVLFFHFFKSSRDGRAWMKTYLRLLLLFLLFYSHVIYAWYLIMVLPFVWYERDKGFVTWLLVLTCFSNAQTIMCAIDRSSLLYSIIPLLIALNVFIFIWRFRPNFLQGAELERVEND